MCTAISLLSGDHYFGRNLDLECSYGESVIVAPRSYRFDFRQSSTLTRHYAIIGTGIVAQGYPLYYDGANEAGLCAAALNFPRYARYSVGSGKDNIAVFELIPWVLGQCETVGQTRRLLRTLHLTDLPFSESYPTTPLHFIISDKKESITLESTESGIHIYDNPVGVLTNSPDFPYHMTKLADYKGIGPTPAENLLAPYADLPDYSRGMGGMGLPGDMSSASRFVRGVYLRSNADLGHSEEERVAGYLRILGELAPVKGCVRLAEGGYQHTVYSCCINASKGVYHYTTYNDPRIRAVRMTEENKCGKELFIYHMKDKGEISYLN